MTEVHGDEEAVRLVDRYCAAMRELLPEHGAHEVKTIGDALLIRVPQAEQAVQLGLRAVLDISGAEHGFPSVRVGMHHGPAIERSGDYFGHTVNVAARVSALAGAGEVLLTDAVMQAAGSLAAVRFIERGRHPLKGISEPVLLYMASPGAQQTPEGLPMDPVCHMAVDPERAAGMLVHEGAQHYFCSLQCARQFATEPTRFA